MQATAAYIRSVIKSNLLIILIFSAVVIGLVSGFLLLALKDRELTSRELMYICFPGDLLLKMLKGIALPLMGSCIVVAIAKLDLSISSRIGAQLMIYIALTKVWSVSLGIFMAWVMGLGKGQKSSHIGQSFHKNEITIDDVFLDLIRNLFPSNMLEMTLRIHETILIKPNASHIDIYDWPMLESGRMRESVNMLGVVNCAMFLGAALATMKMPNRSLLNFFTGLCEVSMAIIVWILWLSPVLIIFLVAGQIAAMGNVSRIVSQVGYYVVVDLLAYSIQLFVVYPLFILIFTLQNPFPLFRDYFDAMVTSFATGSSLAALPVAIKCLEEKSQLDSRVVRFVLPLANNINKDGTAIFMGVATVFIAEMNEMSLSVGGIVTVILLGSAASVATAGVPFGGIVSLVMVLDGVNVPSQDVMMLFAMNWLTDRYGTISNVTGDAVAVAVLVTYNRKLLRRTSVVIESDTTG